MEGLKKLPLIAIAMLLVAASQSECGLDESQLKYMSLPSADGFGQMNSGRLVDALTALMVPGGASIKWIKDAINYRADHPQNPDHANHLKTLRLLSDERAICSHNLVSTVKHMLYLITREQNIVAFDFRDYLVHYGKTKFEKCADLAISLYLIETDERMERALDEYFKTAMGLSSRKMSDDEWLKKLQKFSLVKSQIDMEPLLNMAKWSQSKKSETNEMLLAKLTEDRCSPFAADKNKIHDMLALARVFGSEMEVEPRFLKLSEYRRLCLPVMSRKDEVLKNFRRFLPQEKPKSSIVSKLSCKSADCQDVLEPVRRRA